MNILIVNAFGSSSQERSKFTSFCNLIKNSLKKFSQNSGIDNFCFIYRTPNTINDFIYNGECSPGEETKESLINRKNFEKLDMVFIDGQEKYLPWKDKGYRLYEFIRLCKTTNKILFAAGVAMQFLIYYLATGSNTLFNFINSKGEIQAIEELEQIPINFLKKLKKNDFFLDFVTGDILEYHIINHNWSPIMNIGLHKQISAEKFMSRGKFILPDYFKGKDYISNPEQTIVSNCHEILNKITRENLSHYLVNNIPNEFVGFTSLTWFPHFFNVTFRKYNFQAICLCDKGISVIEHDNSVGVAFHPKLQYKDTNILLENFIKQKFREVQTKLFNFQEKNIFKEDEFPLMFRKFKYNDEENKRKFLSNQKYKITSVNFVENVCNSTAFNREKKVKNEAKHVGFGFNNRDMIFVENNSIIQNPITFEKENEKNKTKQKFTGIGLGDYFSLKRNENTRISEIFKPQYKSNGIDYINKENAKNTKDKSKEIKKTEDDAGMDYLTFIRREKMDENQLIAYYKKTRRNVCLKLKEIDNFSNLKEIINKKNKAKKDKKKNHKVRLKLQTSNSFFKKNNNQPKNLESENFYESNNLKDMEAEYKTLTKGLHSRPIKTAQASKTRIFSKINNFQEEEEESEKEKDIANKWKKYENLSPEQIQRKEFLESKKKWIAKEDFHRHFGARSNSIKPIANIMIYGMPVSSHKYRDINPSKWITPNGFI
jgi:hypothetical protein